jgi:hypothetical protein
MLNPDRCGKRLGDGGRVLGTVPNGAKISRILGRSIAPEGLQDSAQGFNPGKHS